MFIEDIIQACRRVINGNENALRELGLDNVTFLPPTPFNLSLDSLQVAYNQVLHTAVAAGELQLSSLEMQCQMSLMLAFADKKHLQLHHNIDGPDVAEVMLSLINEETARLRAIHAPQEDFSDPEERPPTSPVLIPQHTHSLPPTSPMMLTDDTHTLCNQLNNSNQLLP